MIFLNGGHIMESLILSAKRWPNQVNLTYIQNIKSDLSISMTGYTMVKLNLFKRFSHLEAILKNSSMIMFSVHFAAEKL